MSFSDWRHERFIRNTLRAVAKQRVVSGTGAVWLVNGQVRESDERTVAALRTCHIRGWVEVLADSVMRVEMSGGQEHLASGVGPIYRLTDGGWNVLHRMYGWVLVTCVVAVATLAATLVGLYLAKY